jgi:hypothetical protein
MKSLLSVVAIICLAVGISSFAQTGTKLNVEQLKAVPDGNYLVTLELNGKQERLNFKVQANRAKCVNATDPSLKQIEGQFQAQGSGSFVGRFQGGSFRGSQLWIFRPDGAAAVREIPDRGEQQSAVPVKGDSIEIPKK